MGPRFLIFPVDNWTVMLRIIRSWCWWLSLLMDSYLCELLQCGVKAGSRQSDSFLACRIPWNIQEPDRDHHRTNCGLLSGRVGPWTSKVLNLCHLLRRFSGKSSFRQRSITQNNKANQYKPDQTKATEARFKWFPNLSSFRLPCHLTCCLHKYMPLGSGGHWRTHSNLGRSSWSLSEVL